MPTTQPTTHSACIQCLESPHTTFCNTCLSTEPPPVRPPTLPMPAGAAAPTRPPAAHPHLFARAAALFPVLLAFPELISAQCGVVGTLLRAALTQWGYKWRVELWRGLRTQCRMTSQQRKRFLVRDWQRVKAHVRLCCPAGPPLRALVRASLVLMLLSAGVLPL